ncbi:MAG: hypothetical protein M3O46_06355 [Myxococcota bacterium]|nr:hypothetical protein [Myxococcota bacterium]
MTNMLKGRGTHPSDTHVAEPQSRRKRDSAPVTNHEFVRAFADALRDILHDEPAALDMTRR